MSRIYVHLSGRDALVEIRTKVHGVKSIPLPEPLMKSRECPRCHTQNPSTAVRCSECSAPLIMDDIEEMIESKVKEILADEEEMMRRVLGKPFVKTSFAAWGNKNLKPTDLWGNLPSMVFPIATKWEKAPRGSRTGTQGIKDPAERAKIPYGLSLALCKATEDWLRS